MLFLNVWVYFTLSSVVASGLKIGRHNGHRQKAKRDLGPIQEKWITQIADHDNPSTKHDNTFQQRYFIDTTHYKPGGPVIVLDSGEDSAEDRIPFMQTGIVRHLAESLHGIGIVLEHRYYGISHVTPDLSVYNLRLLNTKQALADNAYFAKNLHTYLPKNMSHIKPDTTPFISYGGSYAGAKSAFLQIAHPDVYYGSIASSGVIWAGSEFWQCYETIRLHANRTCVRVIENMVERHDILAKVGGKPYDDFKRMFGVEELTDPRDIGILFAYAFPWQEANWDSSLSGANDWDNFCTNITANVSLHKETNAGLGLYGTTQGIRNYAAYIKDYIYDNCLSQNQTMDECFKLTDPSMYSNHALANDTSQGMRLWDWQACTEYGYFQTAAPAGHASLISRFIDLAYLKIPCQLRFGFPPDFEPDTDKVNIYGGYNITAPRLFFVDGEADVWLYATAHSPDSPQRHMSAKRGLMIPEGGHHWDENGLESLRDEPSTIQHVHQREIEVVAQWVKEFYVVKT